MIYSMSWPVEQSPFEFQTPVAPDAVVGRDEELASLRAYARSGRAVLVSAPRRYGKTSLLRRAVRDVREQDRVAAVMVDLYGVQTLADVTVRLERAYAAHLGGGIRETASRFLRDTGLGLSLSGTGIGATFQRQPRTDPLPALHALLDLPVRLGARHGRSWVVLDEFQELFAVPGAEGILRAHVQHHRDVAGYAFAGSERTLLDRMFADRERPFFGQAEPQRLGRLAASALAGAITDGFARTERHVGEALEPLLATADGHPQRAMLLASHLWQATPPGTVADLGTWRAGRDAALVATAAAASGRWEQLSPNRRRAARALAEFGTAYTRDAATAVGLPLGSVTASLAQLVETGDLERDGDRYRFIDPLLPLWIRREIAGWRTPDDR